MHSSECVLAHVPASTQTCRSPCREVSLQTGRPTCTVVSDRLSSFAKRRGCQCVCHWDMYCTAAVPCVDRSAVAYLSHSCCKVVRVARVASCLLTGARRGSIALRCQRSLYQSTHGPTRYCYGGLRVNLGDARAFLVAFCSFKVLLDVNQSVSGAGTTGISRYRRQWSL